MRRWRFIMIAVAMVGAALVAGIHRGGEPRFQGRTLSEWIKEEENIQFEANGDSADCGSDPKWRATTNAVYQIGTNAVPWLVKWANAKDSKAKAAVVAWVDGHPWVHWHIRSAAERRNEAMIGFILLKDKAPGEINSRIEVRSSKLRSDGKNVVSGNSKL